MDKNNFAKSIFLAQTDTTAGFLSKDVDAINLQKQSHSKKKLLKEFSSFKALNMRVPTAFKNIIRHSKKTTFILKNNNSFRIANDSLLHLKFLALFDSLHSSSANISKGAFNLDFALSGADIIVKDWRGIFEAKSSKIIKLGNARMIKIRK